METNRFDYDLPQAAIAQVPVEPRDRARLLRVDPRQDLTFVDLPRLLQPGDLLVINRTRVRAARLVGTKPATGGKVELLLLRRKDEQRWDALIKPARRVRPGLALEFGRVRGTVLSHPDLGEVIVALDAGAADIEDVLAEVGETPLPPYIHTELDDAERYQTVFAKTIGSAAAPTAALHFTPQLVASIRDAGVEIAEVDLEVGLDTFRPIASDSIGEHEMHRERWQVPAAAADAISVTRARAGRVVAVGTTVVRTLETAAVGDGLVAARSGETDLFISPGYRLRVVDSVITNFHAPRTTLIVMIATLLGDSWREVYEHALRSGYRFLSFGDAMLIENPVNRR